MTLFFERKSQPLPRWSASDCALQAELLLQHGEFTPGHADLVMRDGVALLLLLARRFCLLAQGQNLLAQPLEVVLKPARRVYQLAALQRDRTGENIALGLVENNNII